MYYVVKTKKFL